MLKSNISFFIANQYRIFINQLLCCKSNNSRELEQFLNIRVKKRSKKIKEKIKWSARAFLFAKKAET